MDKPTAIVACSLLDLGEEARQQHGSLESTKHVLRLHRSQTMPRDPNRIQDIIIQRDCPTTGGLEGCSFLLYDNGADANERTLIFPTIENLCRLCEAMTPNLFTQLYVIIQFGESALPDVFVLLQRKTQATYEHMLKK